MTSTKDLENWISSARSALGDPALWVCQIFAQFLPKPSDGLKINAWLDNQETLILSIAHPPFQPNSIRIPLQFSVHPPKVKNGVLFAFCLQKVTPGIWELYPSLNMPGILHAFVAIYGVPDPAPWEPQVILPGTHDFDPNPGAEEIAG